MTRQQLLISMWGTACRVRNLRLHVQQVGESLAQTVCTKNPAAICSTGGAERDKGSSAVAACIEALKRHHKIARHTYQCLQERRKRCSPTSHVAISSKDGSGKLRNPRAVLPSSIAAVSSSELQEKSPCIAFVG